LFSLPSVDGVPVAAEPEAIGDVSRAGDPARR